MKVEIGSQCQAEGLTLVISPLLSLMHDQVRISESKQMLNSGEFWPTGLFAAKLGRLRSGADVGNTARRHYSGKRRGYVVFRQRQAV